MMFQVAEYFFFVILCYVSSLCLFQMMEQLTDHHYDVLTVPEESAANCVYIKGPSKQDFLLHRPAEECPESLSVSNFRFNPLS